MIHQSWAQESAKQQCEEEQEPIVLGNRSGIVIIWPDGYAHPFSWSELRQACSQLKVVKRRVMANPRSRETVHE